MRQPQFKNEEIFYTVFEGKFRMLMWKIPDYTKNRIFSSFSNQYEPFPYMKTIANIILYHQGITKIVHRQGITIQKVYKAFKNKSSHQPHNL